MWVCVGGGGSDVSWCAVAVPVCGVVPERSHLQSGCSYPLHMHVDVLGCCCVCVRVLSLLYPPAPLTSCVNPLPLSCVVLPPPPPNVLCHPPRWDYGYQITGMANRTVIVDNNTWNNTHIATVGRAMASNEEDAYQIMQVRAVLWYAVVWCGVVWCVGGWVGGGCGGRGQGWVGGVQLEPGGWWVVWWLGSHGTTLSLGRQPPHSPPPGSICGGLLVRALWVQWLLWGC